MAVTLLGFPYGDVQEGPMTIRWESKEGTRQVVGETVVRGERRFTVQTGDSHFYELLRPEELQAQMARDARNLECRCPVEPPPQREEYAVPGETELAKARARQALERNMLVNGVLVTRRDAIRERVAAGWRVVGVSPSRRLVSPEGTFLDEKQLSKTAMDYAEMLGGCCR